MTHEEFTIWLQGYFEVSGKKEIGKEEVKIIRGKLDTVINPPFQFNYMTGDLSNVVLGTC